MEGFPGKYCKWESDAIFMGAHLKRGGGGAVEIVILITGYSYRKDP